ncbi:MAG: succinate dehydrogenase/fumarate reductase iron-sulfur subunit [Leptotrichiaceae bacterium]|nr:succinate dehydrogenase/fumarate reductase iron-sulfur subunit [Leptotrichiaceae bacterium]
MKKLLGLLALTLAVSGVASADQDFLKSINFDTNVRYRYMDLDTTEGDSPFIGNEGFSKENRVRTRWYKTVSGTVVLSDEFGLEADFAVVHRNQTDRIGNFKRSKEELWNPSLTIKKGIQLGNLETIFKLKYENETTRPRENGATGEYRTGGIFNEITFGPEFRTNILGQNIKVDTGVVYFKMSGVADNNLPTTIGNMTDKGKADGWGLNFNLSKDGTIVDAGFGKITYGLDFINKFRDIKGEFGGEKVGSNVYLDYLQNVTYTTPTLLGGFYGQLILENEWEKHTSVTGWNNNFDIVTGLGYKTSFDTSVGEITINPYTSYSILNRESNYNKDRDNKRITIERNEIRAGLKLGLAVK